MAAVAPLLTTLRIDHAPVRLIDPAMPTANKAFFVSTVWQLIWPRSSRSVAAFCGCFAQKPAA